MKQENQTAEQKNLASKLQAGAGTEFINVATKDLPFGTPLDMIMNDDRIIIEPEEAPKVTSSGIFIPDTAQAEFKPLKGVLVAIGGGLADRPLKGKIFVGERVLFTKYAGSELVYDANDGYKPKTYLTLRASDLLSIIPPYTPERLATIAKENETKDHYLVD